VKAAEDARNLATAGAAEDARRLAIARAAEEALCAAETRAAEADQPCSATDVDGRQHKLSPVFQHGGRSIMLAWKGTSTSGISGQHWR
jgi:hypothetical protein